MPKDKVVTYTINKELYDNLVALLEELKTNANEGERDMSFLAYWYEEGEKLAEQCLSDLQFTEPDEYYHLTSDDDGHWYIIPVSEHDNFENWVEDTTEGEDSEFDFDNDMISGHPNIIHFKEWYEE